MPESAQETIAKAVEVVRRFASTYEPPPAVVLFAGSRARGNSTAHSDYDLVFLYPDLLAGAWREMKRSDGADFEVFAHDLGTLAYFLAEIERPSAKPVLARMVDEGLLIHGEQDPIATEARHLAQEFLAAGPLPLDEADRSTRRYTISNLAETLRAPFNPAERLAIGSSLYIALAGFVLSTHGHWLADGKAIPAALHSLSPELEQRFNLAFEHLFSTGQDATLQTLVTDLLEPFGGRLRSGFHQQAPASWRR